MAQKVAGSKPVTHPILNCMKPRWLCQITAGLFVAPAAGCPAPPGITGTKTTETSRVREASASAATLSAKSRFVLVFRARVRSSHSNGVRGCHVQFMKERPTLQSRFTPGRRPPRPFVGRHGNKTAAAGCARRHCRDTLAVFRCGAATWWMATGLPWTLTVVGVMVGVGMTEILTLSPKL